MPDYQADGLKRLHLAILLQAIADYRQKPHPYLKNWLLTDGLYILEAYDQPVDQDAWLHLVGGGFPGNFRSR